MDVSLFSTGMIQFWRREAKSDILITGMLNSTDSPMHEISTGVTADKAQVLLDLIDAFERGHRVEIIVSPRK